MHWQDLIVLASFPPTVSESCRFDWELAVWVPIIMSSRRLLGGAVLLVSLEFVLGWHAWLGQEVNFVQPNTHVHRHSIRSTKLHNFTDMYILCMYTSGISHGVLEYIFKSQVIVHRAHLHITLQAIPTISGTNLESSLSLPLMSPGQLVIVVTSVWQDPIMHEIWHSYVRNYSFTCICIFVCTIHTSCSTKSQRLLQVCSQTVLAPQCIFVINWLGSTTHMCDMLRMWLCSESVCVTALIHWPDHAYIIM